MSSSWGALTPTTPPRLVSTNPRGDVRLAVVALHHGEEEVAQADPGAAAVGFGLLMVGYARRGSRVSRSGGRLPLRCRRCRGSSGPRSRRRGKRRGSGRGGPIVASGLSRDHRGGDVQLEVRVPRCSLAHARPHQCALVAAHFALQPPERAAHLPPEAPRVGEETLAVLGFAVVVALQVGDSTYDARLRILTQHGELHGAPHLPRSPRAPHTVRGVDELPAAADRGPDPLRSDVLRHDGQQYAGSQSPQQQQHYLP